MTTLEEEDYYGMDDFLNDANVKQYTNDWPGNDPLSHRAHQSPAFAEFENYLPVRQSPTDSGNHSPTSTSSDGNSSNSCQIWNTHETVFAPHTFDSPPIPADLDAIESLLYDKSGKTIQDQQLDQYYEDIYVDDESPDVFYNDEQYYCEEPEYVVQNSQNQVNNGHFKIIASPPVQKSIRPTPYQVIRPIRGPATQVAPVSAIPVIPATATVTNGSLISQPKYVICSTSNEINPLPNNAIFVSNVVPMVKQESSLFNKPEPRSASNMEYVKKSEERKRRNRESAQISREKKKVEYDQMKARITELEDENSTLRLRLANCRCSVVVSSANFNGGKGASMNGAKTAVITLLAICAVVSFAPFRTLSPIEDPIQPQQITSELFNGTNSTSIVLHVGNRALLTADDDYNYRQGFDLLNASRKMSNETILPKCPNANGYLNTSQLLKVNNDLINWIDNHEKMNLVQLRSGNSPYLIYNSHKQLTIPDYDEYVIVNSTEIVNVSQTKKFEGRRRNDQNLKQRERAWRHMNMISPKNAKVDDNALIPMSVQEQIMKQLAAQLKQNDDTLYVMALKDYIILPRTATKSGESPKVSIILPALSLNSTITNHIPMMRIECTVTSTNLFFMPSRLVSLFNGSVPN